MCQNCAEKCSECPLCLVKIEEVSVAFLSRERKVVKLLLIIILPVRDILCPSKALFSYCRTCAKSR